MRTSRSLIGWLLAGLLLLTGSPALANRTADREQSRFGIEEGVKRPVRLPASVLKILSHDERIALCLRHGNAAPEQVPDSWFLASEVHLSDAGGVDLVVQARPQRDRNLDNSCLFGANIGPFWVFRHTLRDYQLALETDVLGLQILKSKTNGYRDIECIQATAAKRITVYFRFDGSRYQPGPSRVKSID